MHHYIDHYLVHGRGMGHPCIKIESTEKMSEILEQVDNCVEAGGDAFGCLVHLVTRMAT